MKADQHSGQEEKDMEKRFKVLLPVFLWLALAPPVMLEAEDTTAEVAAARAVFAKNLQAIREKDRDAYLACYLDSERLARTGLAGFEVGYAGLAATAGEGWPDHIEAEDLRLTPLRPGLVYGTYRYRVRYGAEEVAGLSERLFVDTPQGWRIAMTTAFPSFPASLHRLARWSAPPWWTAPAGPRSETPSFSCAKAGSSARALAPPARCRPGWT
jgi:hypothetical protein